MPYEIPSIEDQLLERKRIEQIQKDTIIQQKMETLFGYKEFHITVKEFKKQIYDIMDENDKLTETENAYQNVLVNEKQISQIEKQHIFIQTERNHLYDLSLSTIDKKTNLDDIVTINNRITKLYLELRKMKYDFMEMHHSYEKKEFVSKLVQKENYSRDVELCLEPTIETYFMKPIKDEDEDEDEN